MYYFSCNRQIDENNLDIINILNEFIKSSYDRDIKDAKSIFTAKLGRPLNHLFTSNIGDIVRFMDMKYVLFVIRNSNKDKLNITNFSAPDLIYLIEQSRDITIDVYF